MSTVNSTETNNMTVRPVPPDQVSPKAVLLSIFRLKYVFKRNWKILLGLVLAGGIIGFVKDKLTDKKVIYSATTTFNLGGASNSFGDMGALATAFGLGQAAPEANIFVGDNFMIYAKSRPVVEKTLMKTVNIKGKDTLLLNYYIRHGGILDDEWEENEELRTYSLPQAKKPEEYTMHDHKALAQIYTRIQNEIGVSQPERKSSFMQLRAGMEDEDLAKAFVETHLETIEEDYRQKQTKKTREMHELLKRRADSLGRELGLSETRLARYQDQNQQVVVAEGRVQETKLTRNSSFLTTVYFQALQSEENMKLSLIREAPLFTIIEPVSLPLFREVKSSAAMQVGIALGLFFSVIIIFFRETYRSIMQEG
ncbi:hypothetical protein GCM10023187_21550 [Nibrella viscosa]|uniref:Lipopolysaccharide biosynthesis protein n=1 Tax=Nibrella viscosa TaxID=1084524 RepID=A0ABP8KEJ1_9BACT